MTIDIDGLSEAELVDLNNRVVACLRPLAGMRAHASPAVPPPNVRWTWTSELWKVASLALV